MVDYEAEALAALAEFGQEGITLASCEDPSVMLTDLTGIVKDPASLEGERPTVNLLVWFSTADFGGYVPKPADTVTVSGKEYEVLTVDTDVNGGTTLGLRQTYANA